MELTRSQLSYNFVQPKLLDMPSRSGACNFSYAAPEGVTWPSPSIASQVSSQAASAAQTALKQRALLKGQSAMSRSQRRQAAGLDQVKAAAPRPSMLSADSSSSLSADNMDSPWGQLLFETEKRLSIRGSLRTTALTAGLQELFPIVEAPAVTPAVDTASSVLPAELPLVVPVLPSLPADATVMAAGSDAIGDLFSPTQLNQEESTAPVKQVINVQVSCSEVLSVVEKAGVAKVEVSGSCTMQVLGTHDAADLVGRVGVFTVDDKKTWDRLSTSSGVSLRPADGGAGQTVTADLSIMPTDNKYKLFTYSTLPSFQPMILKAKNMVTVLGDALQVTVQIALNPQHTALLKGFSVAVSLSALLTKLGMSNEQVSKQLPHSAGNGYHSTRRIITWAVEQPVSTAERKLTFTAEVSLTTEALEKAKEPAVCAMVIKASQDGLLTDAALNALDEEKEGVALSITAGTTLEWKYL